MAALHKCALMDVTRFEFDKLAAVIRPIEADVATQKDDNDTSIKDVVAHRAHWIDLFLGWYADGKAGKQVSFPAPGYKWNDLKRYNADLRQSQMDVSWPAATRMLHHAHDRLCGFLEGHREADLYGAPMKGANNAWTAGRWAEAAGPSHYRSATKYIRRRLK